MSQAGDKQEEVAAPKKSLGSRLLTILILLYSPFVEIGRAYHASLRLVRHLYLRFADFIQRRYRMRKLLK